jgi:hypothetical protein
MKALELGQTLVSVQDSSINNAGFFEQIQGRVDHLHPFVYELPVWLQWNLEDAHKRHAYDESLKRMVDTWLKSMGLDPVFDRLRYRSPNTQFTVVNLKGRPYPVEVLTTFEYVDCMLGATPFEYLNTNKVREGESLLYTQNHKGKNLDRMVETLRKYPKLGDIEVSGHDIRIIEAVQANLILPE